MLNLIIGGLLSAGLGYIARLLEEKSKRKHTLHHECLRLYLICVRFSSSMSIMARTVKLDATVVQQKSLFEMNFKRLGIAEEQKDQSFVIMIAMTLWNMTCENKRELPEFRDEVRNLNQSISGMEILLKAVEPPTEIGKLSVYLPSEIAVAAAKMSDFYKTLAATFEIVARHVRGEETTASSPFISFLIAYDEYHKLTVKLQALIEKSTTIEKERLSIVKKEISDHNKLIVAKTLQGTAISKKFL